MCLAEVRFADKTAKNSHEDLDKESLLFLAIRSHEQISFADMTYDQ